MKPRSFHRVRSASSLAAALLVLALTGGSARATDIVLSNLTVNDGSTYTVGSGNTLTVGSGSGNYLYVASGSGTTGTLDVSLASAFTANVGNFYVGTGSSGGTGTAKLGTNNTITAATLFGVGTSFWDWTTGTLTTADSGTTTIHTPDFKVGWAIANGTSSGTGTITLGSGASLTVDGVVAGNASGRAAMWIGYDEEQYGRSSSGIVNLSAGTASLTLSSLMVGGQTGNGSTPGTLTFGISGSNHLDVSGAGNVVQIGYLGLFGGSGTGSGTGTVTLANLDASSAVTTTDNSTAILIGNRVAGASGSTTGTLNLTGGSLTITTTGTAIGTAGSGGTSYLNLDGITLKAGASSTTWLQGLTSAKIKSGGVTFDTGTNNITVAQPLLTDSGSPGGGLTKDGLGTLTLTGAATYTGVTAISGGKLVIGSGGTINSSSSISIGAGELRVNNSTTALSLAPGFSTTGGALGGTGVITPAVTITSGNSLAPGDNGGTLTLSGALALNTGANVKIDNPGSSLAQVNNDYTDGLGAHSLFVSGTPSLNTPYTFLQWTGSSGSLPDGAQSNWTLSPTIQGITANWVGSSTSDTWTTSSSWLVVNGYSGSVNADTTNKKLTFTLTGETGTNATPGAINDVAIDPSTANISITGSGTTVAVNSLRVGGPNNSNPILTLGSGNLTVATTVTAAGNGTLNATAGALIVPTLNVSGATAAVTLGHADGVLTTANVSAGTLTVNAGALTTANLTGGTLAVNGGSVPTANLSGSGTLAGTQAVPQVNVTGGAPGFTGNATVMTVSGGGVTTTGGTIATLNHNTGAGSSTIGAATTISTANVNAGTVNFNSTQANGTLSLPKDSTGTVVVGSGAKVAIADVSAGAGTVHAANPLSITGTLKLTSGITATLTGGTSFTAAGANLANSSSASTLALSGGKLTFQLPPGGQLVPISTAPVAWYQFNSSGTLGTDSSGNGYNFTTVNNGPTVDASGKFGTGIVFDNTKSQYLEMSGTTWSNLKTALASGTGQTAILWVKKAASQVAQQNTSGILKGLGTGSNSHYTWDNSQAYFNDFGSDRIDSIPAPSSTIQQSWVMIALVRDPSDAGAGRRVYFNPSTSGATPASTKAASTLSWGATFDLGMNESNLYLGGSMDNVMLFNKALSAAELATLYNDPGTYAASFLNLPNMTIAASAGVTSTLDLGETGTPSKYHVLGGLNLTAGLSGNTELLLENGLNVQVNGISAAYPAGGSGAHSASIADGSNAPLLSLTSGSDVSVDPNVTLSIGSVIGNPESGSTALTKTGAGTLTLNGANTYTGATTVNAGTLVMDGDQSAATGGVTVAAGATNATAVRLKGSGTVGGHTGFAADADGAGAQVGGVHSPGTSVGKQTFDQAGANTTNLTYNAGSIFEWELAGTPAATVIADESNYASNRGTAYDAVNVTGTLGGSDAIFRIVLDGSQTFADTFWTANRAWTDIFRTGDGTGSTNVSFAARFGGGFQYYNHSGTDGALAALNAPTSGNFSLSDNTLTWNYTAVPEPSGAVAAFLLGAGLLRRRRGVSGQ